MAHVLGEERLGWMTSKATRDEVDITALVERYATLLYRVAFSVVRNQAEAEDIVQESFLRAFERKQKLLEVVEMRAWLVRVTWNLALDRKRRLRPTQMDEEIEALAASSELSTDRRLIAAAELRGVLAAVDRLPLLERAVLLLGAVEELSVAEIAIAIGRSESSVRSLTFRARAHLQERLNTARPKPVGIGKGRGTP